MALTGNHITTMLRAAGASTTGLVASPDKIASLFNDAILRYGDGKFTTTAQVAALISECMMESAWFRTTEEYVKTGRYAPYIGRGFIQVTWKTNYAAFGKWAVAKRLISDPDYFVKNPTHLADLKWAALTGVWYFTHVLFDNKPLVAYADVIDQVGKAVNLGNPFSSITPNGQSARRAAYRAVLALGHRIVPQPPPNPVPDSGTVDRTTQVHVDVFPTADAIHTPFGQWGPSWSWGRGTDKAHPSWGKHTGDDWHRNAGAAEIGDPIYAVADGRVIFAGYSTSLGWGPAFGNHVLITWDKTLPGESGPRTSIDAHMVRVAAKYNQRVKAGDLIGYKGMTGNVSGPHDHHEQHLGQGWGSPRVKPVYPGRTITKTVEFPGVPIMAKPDKLHRTVDRVVKQSRVFHSLPLDNDGKVWNAAEGPGTIYLVANIVTDKDCWARVVTMSQKPGATVYDSRYDRVQIKAGGDQVVWWDTIGGPRKGFSRKIVRVQLLAYSSDITVSDLFVRVGKES